MDENLKLKLQISVLRGKCMELKFLEQMYKQSNIQCSSAQEQVNKLQSEVNLLKETFGKSQDALAMEEKDKIRLQEEFQKIEDKLTESTKECQQLVSSKNNLQNDLEEREKTIKQLEHNHQKLKKTIEDQEIFITNDLKRQLTDAQTEIDKITKENRELSDCLENADNEIQRRMRQIEVLENETKNNVQLKDIIEKLEVSVKEKDIKIQKLTDENKQMLEQNSMEIQNLKRELADNVQSKDETVETVLENRNLRIKNRDLKNQVLSIVKENDKLQAKDDENEEKMQNFELTLQEANSKIMELENQSKHKEECIQKLKEDLNNLENSLKHTTTEKDDLIAKTNQLQKALDTVNEEFSETKEEYKKWKGYMDNVLKEKVVLLEKLEVMEKAKENTITSVEDEMQNALISLTIASKKILEELESAKQKVPNNLQW